ncbi:MAG: hypothetical protein ACI9WS_003220, partial [Paraglaciecola psychrophila]
GPCSSGNAIKLRQQQAIIGQYINSGLGVRKG